ncbi:MAG: hypothetical protein AMJ43_06490 [Coxiella sp. DG_40]|nr:MAG: hypothetical protein AMJ43_06490 [Coxiella sp. DG_40]
MVSVICSNTVDAASDSPFTAEHLPAFLGAHPGPKTHLTMPFYLTDAMIFHIVCAYPKSKS